MIMQSLASNTSKHGVILELRWFLIDLENGASIEWNKEDTKG